MMYLYIHYHEHEFWKFLAPNVTNKAGLDDDARVLSEEEQQ